MEYQNENFGGEYDFRSGYHKGWHVGEHLHEYSELLFCKSGECHVTVGGQKLLLKKGELAWIPPNYVHKYDGDENELICAVFSNDFIPLFFKKLSGRYLRVRAVKMEELAEVMPFLLTLEREDYVTLSGYLNLIAARVLADSEFDSARHTDGILYQKVISFLSEHYTEDITLSLVARRLGYNEKYISHTLHGLTGIHFRYLLLFYRISHAKRMLESEKEISITRVAAESGFSAINTFNRVFKESVGITPSAYRKQFFK